VRRTGLFRGKVLIIMFSVHTAMVLLLVPVEFCVQFACKSPHLAHLDYGYPSKFMTRKCSKD
jgi:hypothetical protein